MVNHYYYMKGHYSSPKNKALLNTWELQEKMSVGVYALVKCPRKYMQICYGNIYCNNACRQNDMA